MTVTLFLATPLGTPYVHHAYLTGALLAMQTFRGRLATGAQMGSFLPRNRDALTRDFLASGATHMLCVDSDIGWHPSQVQQLIDADREFVGGIYCQKSPELLIPTKLVGELSEVCEVEHLPAGFLLLRRSVIEKMIRAYPELRYDYGYALWSYSFERGVTYAQEDVAFCRRWRALGEPIWMHTGVVVPHYGDVAFVPSEASWARLRGE